MKFRLPGAMLKITCWGMLTVSLLTVYPEASLPGNASSVASLNGGNENPESAGGNCAFITHDCELCTPAPDGKVVCSSVGIACQATAWRCLMPQVDTGEQPEKL